MKNVMPARPYLRHTKNGIQLIVPSKHTISKATKKVQYEKEKSSAVEETKNERESR